MGKLYIVATPIGNLEDITFRAIRTLKEVDLILCEDTSNAQKLLKRYEIDTKTSVYFSGSKLSHTEKIFKLLEEGKDVALISDAGTPAISDPGAMLVAEVLGRFGCNPLLGRGQGEVGISIIPIPGASAITSLYSVSGVFGNSFSFLGFIPQKKGRETFLKKALEEIEDKPVLFYESVHRVEKLLEQLESFASLEFKVIVGRELTKMHEEIVRGNLQEIKDYFKENKDKIRGEFVFMIYK